MNSNENLNDDSKLSRPNIKRNIFYLITIGVGVLCGLIVLVVIKGSDTKSNTTNTFATEGVTVTVPVETPTPTVDPFSDADKKRYLDFVSDYNRAVQEYNENIHGFNNIIKQFSTYEFLKLPDSYPQEEMIAEEFDSDKFLLLSELEKQRQSMIEQGKQAVENSSLLCVNLYNCIIDEYNQLVDEYNALAKVGVIDYICDLPQKAEQREHISKLNEEMRKGLVFFSYEFDRQLKDNEELATYCVMLQQIINPSEEWVIARLKEVKEITGVQAVTADNDPNQLLGKTGGYTSCVYFSDENIDQSTVRGTDIVAKGTDCGGAIEVYENREYALNRCEYLSQFDGTLLYSGSYTVIGTIVIRTSYKLNSQGQVSLTNSIAEVFTRVDNAN